MSLGLYLERKGEEEKSAFGKWNKKKFQIVSHNVSTSLEEPIKTK